MEMDTEKDTERATDMDKVIDWDTDTDTDTDWERNRNRNTNTNMVHVL
jgi:hypothetical protein